MGAGLGFATEEILLQLLYASTDVLNFTQYSMSQIWGAFHSLD